MNATNEWIREEQANDELTRRIRNCLAAKRTELGQLQIRVDGGTVYLSGRLASFHARQIAVSVARHVEGVHQIVDGILVQSPAVATTNRR